MGLPRTEAPAGFCRRRSRGMRPGPLLSGFCRAAQQFAQRPFFNPIFHQPIENAGRFHFAYYDIFIAIHPHLE